MNAPLTARIVIVERLNFEGRQPIGGRFDWLCNHRLRSNLINRPMRNQMRRWRTGQEIGQSSKRNPCLA